nr:MAG TPA: hypothetical protein [Caudoviricetes sp.]
MYAGERERERTRVPLSYFPDRPGECNTSRKLSGGVKQKLFAKSLF